MSGQGRGIFQILEILWTDDHAVVCVAEERGPLEGRRVALKVLRQGIHNRAMLSRVRDEARMLGRLRHPSILHVYQMHTYGGRPVVEMELVQGISLDDLFHDYANGLPLDAALKLVRRTALALDAAYNRPDGIDGRPMRIVHRDLNPTRIYVSIDGMVKVVDFTLAKGHFPDRATESLYLVAGKGSYAAPEIREAEATPAADVYALGLVLFQCVTGMLMQLPPYPLRHDAAVDEYLAGVRLQARDEIVIPLLDLVRSMVRYDQNARPEHRSVAEAIERLLDVGGFHHGLSEFAQVYVLPRWRARPRYPAREHPEYPEVAFIEEGPPDEPISGEGLTRTEVEDRVWQIVSRTGWSNRLAELQQLLITSGQKIEQPFLPVLDRASVPAWKFWAREAPTEDIMAALTLLADSPNPEVVQRIRDLSAHDDEHVRKRAKEILESRRQPA